MMVIGRDSTHQNGNINGDLPSGTVVKHGKLENPQEKMAGKIIYKWEI